MISKPNVEEPHDNKKKKVETSPCFPLSSLPDELALSCLARVSPLDYTALSCVSKRHRSLVVSHELYNMRSQMGLTEKVHYICLSIHHNLTPRWCILRREKTKFGLIPITSSPNQYFGSSVVVLDWGIYVIGGWISMKPTSDVWLLDCRTHTWSKLPSMKVSRHFGAAGVVDGKIYVFGGCMDIDSLSFGEVFDPKTQTWDTLVPLSDRNIGLALVNASFVMEDKLYAVENGEFQNKMLYYWPSEGKWGGSYIDFETLFFSPYVIIDELSYSFDNWRLSFWSMREEVKWKEVKGLDSLHKTIFTSGTVLSDMINFGENIVVFWRPPGPEFYGTSSEIRFAEISLERRTDGEIWGKVEWLDTLITLEHPKYHNGYVSNAVTVNL